MTDDARDRALMRKALHPLLLGARSRLKYLERDERICGKDKPYQLAEIKGERKAWGHIVNDIEVRLIRLKDPEEVI